jgi:hypothetical protein
VEAAAVPNNQFMKFTNISSLMKIQKFLLIAAYCFAAFILSVQAQTEDLPYDSGSQGEDGDFKFSPQLAIGINDAAIAYDSKKDEVLVFGGLKYSLDPSDNNYKWKPSSDTWVWTKRGGWQLKNPAAAANTPPARIKAQLCYDQHKKKAILVGGYGADGKALQDTWNWDGDRWTKVTESSFPETVDFNSAASVYDEKNKEVILLSRMGGDFEIHAWDGDKWILKQRSGSFPDPSQMCLAYDQKNKQVVLLADDGTWVYDGSVWEKKSPANSPLQDEDNQLQDMRGKMAYDQKSKQVLFFGGLSEEDLSAPLDRIGNETWAWDGVNWEKLQLERNPSARSSHAVVGIKDGVLLVGGYQSCGAKYSNDQNPLHASTEFWDGEKWNHSGGGIYEVDMSEKADGVWRYKQISIPKGMVVRFKKNAANTPVCWLATGNVEINGIIDVSGEAAWNVYNTSVKMRNSPQGGPGGFDGGRGGIRYDESGSYSGMPGVGPGGGEAGKESSGSIELSYGKSGGFTGSADSSEKPVAIYGNSYLQPLMGGSGGGGSASFSSMDGAPGGGGGGAILIASSRDIMLNGKILANGGANSYSMGSNYFHSGAGSGGAIRLVADRVTGSGSMSAKAGLGSFNSTTSFGRIRIEAYERELVNSKLHSPTPFQAPPMESQSAPDGSPIKSHGKLWITEVSGQKNVTQPATGHLETPDVVFNAAGVVKIVVAASPDVADGTRVRVRVAMLGEAIESELKPLAGGKAEFEVNLPAGVGTIQTYSERTITYTDDEVPAPSGSGGGG